MAAAPSTAQLAALLATVDPQKLTYGQPQGWNCALCGTALREDQLLGSVEMTYGGDTREQVELWVCRPLCREVAPDA
ncbi:hypothetical protein [Streptomyces coffeae]|uniref:Uncharacterized protein n=1 Tax=Streptomyces coffeae TaxID=621382 RepID=A0ABS1NNU9_9ACTN|nr:hypothetical protein [Streptomyces coffeae]MBL1101572.1 hypothetical protein [Streptomyces coffeae]